MAWDQQGYYQDPNQMWDQQQYHDPYDPYGGFYYGEPEVDPEEERLRKEQERKERREALESNRLYLKKVRKQCVKEDFVDLENLQLFLFEVLIESLEVNSESTLGLVSDDENIASYVTVRVQFLNSPTLEICEKDLVVEGSPRESEGTQTTQLFEQLAEAHRRETDDGNVRESEGESVEGVKELQYTTRWGHASGKSCLFSMTALGMIQDLERFPVNLQVARCVMAQEHSPEICEPLGYARVRLPDEFSLSVLQSCKEGVVLPVASVHRETCDLKNVFGVKKGKADVFVRLSSFGPAIITSFQSVGDDRRYVFKPSPMSSHFTEEKEPEAPRNVLLNPVFAEEDTTVGISVLQEPDIFQKPVLWKTGPLSCGCAREGDCFMNLNSDKRFSSSSSMRLPSPSDVTLCRDVQTPTDARLIKKFGEPMCDWHNLVGLEIKNSPGGNCGCIDSADGPHKNSKHPMKKNGGTKKKTSFEPQPVRMTSRMLKMTMKDGPKGFGVRPEEQDCECDCAQIRDTLQSNKLFLI